MCVISDTLSALQDSAISGLHVVTLLRLAWPYHCPLYNMASNNDVKYLMDKLEKFGQGLFADGANKTEDVVYLRQKNGSKGNQPIYFEAVPHLCISYLKSILGLW